MSEIIIVESVTTANTAAAAPLATTEDDDDGGDDLLTCTEIAVAIVVQPKPTIDLKDDNDDDQTKAADVKNCDNLKNINNINNNNNNNINKKNLLDNQIKLEHKCESDVTADDKLEVINSIDVATATKSANTEIIIKNNNCGATDVNDSKEIDGACDKSINLPLKPILTNGGSSGSTTLPKNGTVNSFLRKKSVSFDATEESVQKFIEGEPIVDKQNPFRSTPRSYEKPPNGNLVIKKQKTDSKKKSPAATSIVAGATDSDYVTTEEVLKQSKYVKTYIKNPDEHFTYDSSVLEKLRESIPSSDNYIPVPLPPPSPQKKPVPSPRSGSSGGGPPKLSKTTKERLKELKVKYSPPFVYTSQDKLQKIQSTPDQLDGKKKSRLSIDRSKYPDLSDIKVKTGTDLEKSFYNPKEVALNVKKFDSRFKEARFGSQDDLDDIADLTEADADELRKEYQEEAAAAAAINDKNNDGKKSFTNTVNSEEFKEFLKKKGLTLIPESGGTESKNSDQQFFTETNNDYENSLNFKDTSSDELDDKMDTNNKNAKKRSVLQRIFHGGLFSSKGKTTPKEAPIQSHGLYAKSTEDLKDNAMKRVVLERASYHAPSSNQTSLPANNEFDKHFNPRSKANTAGGSSSMNNKSRGMSTHAEDYLDMNMASSSRPMPVNRGRIKSKDDHRENYIDMKLNNEAINSDQKHPSKLSRLTPVSGSSKSSSLGVRYIDSSDGSNNAIVVDPQQLYRSIDITKSKLYQSRLKTPANGRSSVPVTYSEPVRTVELRDSNLLVSFETKTPDVRDGVVKPRVQRPNIPISELKPLPNRGKEFMESTPVSSSSQSANKINKNLKPPVPLKRTVERQSLIHRRSEESQYGNLNRTNSLPKKSVEPPRLPQRNNMPINSNQFNIEGVPAQVKISRAPIIYGGNVASPQYMNSPQKVTPTVSREQLLDAPKSTSTPNDKTSENVKGLVSQSDKEISPITTPAQKKVQDTINVDINTWTKIRELKEIADRELLYRTPVSTKAVAQLTASQLQQQQQGRRISENIYESTEKLQPVVSRQSQQNVNQATPMRSSLNSPQEQQVVFVRSSPQRNTIGSIYRNRNLKIVDGQYVDESNNVIDPRQFVNAEKNTISPMEMMPEKRIAMQQTPQQQPPRSQSVLDDMITGQTYAIISNNRPGSIAQTPVILRRRQQATMSREEILNRVKEFCRKSMNKTPTNLKESKEQLSTQTKSSPEISPVSYASVDTQKSNTTGRISSRMAPQVPQRVQSLQKMPQTPQPATPIYATSYKRASLQSTVSDVFDGNSPKRTIVPTRLEMSATNRAQTFSDSDSVFMPDNKEIVDHRSHYQTPPTPRIYNQQNEGGKVMPQQQQQQQIYAPIRRPIPESMYGYSGIKQPSQSPQLQLQEQQQQQQQQQRHQQYQQQPVENIYGRTQIPISYENQYGNVQLRNGMSGAIPAQRIRSSSVLANPIQRSVPQAYLTNTNDGHQQVIIPRQFFIDGRTTPLVLHAAYPQQNLVLFRGADDQQQLQQQQQQMLQQQQQYSKPIAVRQVQPQYRPIVQRSNNENIIVRNDNPSHNVPYESESGSEAGEVQRIMQNLKIEEDWQNEKGARNQQTEQAAADDRRRGGRSGREDPRRHTLGGDMLHYGSGQGPPQRTMDLEMGTRSQKVKKAPPVRGYTPMNQGPLFDDDPGIMSEVETASTGFRRGGKQRSSLPVVRTPSKTLERPLGLVFLQYRSETKRALLPNEITSIDTVRALFVRSFPRQLTMAYLEGPNVKIYIHDASKDMFYELEDVRSHLREIRDRSVLRLFESNEVAAPQVLPGGPGVPQPLPPTGTGHWDQDQSYFSEPEFDSEYQHQHIHKSKAGKGAPYYVGAAQTLPRGMYSDRNKNAVGAPAKPLRSYGSRGSMGPPFPYPPDQLYSIPDGYMSSPERGTRGGYEEPYYSQYGTRGGTVTPIIDEEQSETSLADDQYSLYGVKVTGRIPRNPNQMYDPTRPEDLHRIRVEHMERQLANLTGLVQKALNQNPQMTPVGSLNQNYLGVPGQCRGVPDDIDGHSSSSSTSMQDKSVSFEKSVSFSDDIQGVPKSHSPQHPADSKPPKPAIKSSTLPRTSSQERDRLKPPPPPKPLGLVNSHPNYRPDLALAPEVYNHLRGLQKKAKDLRTEVRTLRRLSQAQAVAVREDIKDTFMRIRATLLASSGNYWGQGDQDKTRLSRDEELYKQEVIRLEKDLGDLEASVEGLRGEVINRRTRVNMAAVEDMALVLSRASKTVAELKMRFPGLQNGLRNILANEMEKVVREEKFLKDEPERLESALRRCKKLTGTLVTLKRLASVQEQRTCVDPPQETEPSRTTEVQTTNKPIPSPRLGTVSVSGGVAPENALDALLDELQTFAKPSMLNSELRPDDSTSDDSSQTLQNTVTTQLSQSSLFPSDPAASNIGLRRLHSYPSGSDTDTSPPQPLRPVGKPPVPERNVDLLSKVSNKRIPPPPPPRTSSRSPLASPTSPNLPIRLPSVTEAPTEQQLQQQQQQQMNLLQQQDGGNSSSGESNHSQDHMQRQISLELRHQELLKKQKILQEQYARLQQMSKNNVTLPPGDIMHLKKTGSESNLPQKMGLNMSVSGSMKNLNADNNAIMEAQKNEKNQQESTTTSKVYETDIL